MRHLLAPLVPNHLLGAALAASLAVVAIAGIAVVLTRTRRSQASLPGQMLLVLVIALTCVPGLQPWHLLPVALFLPCAPSAGLALWTLAAPCATLIQDPAWAALCIHLPPLALALSEGLIGLDLSRFGRRVPVVA